MVTNDKNSLLLFLFSMFCVIISFCFSFERNTYNEKNNFVERVYSINDSEDNDELFNNYFNSVFYQDEFNKPITFAAKSKLKQTSKNLYDYLAEKIVSVANGELETTYFSISKDELEQLGAKTIWTATELGIDEIEKLDPVFTPFMENLGVSDVVTALLHDFPYELYWFDKTSTGGVNESLNGYEDVIKDSIVITNFTISFRVANNYKAVNYNEKTPSVNIEKTGATISAVNNAKAIVDKYKNLSDYQKLVAYKDEICNAVIYNSEAANPSYTGGYSDPWQLIYVFDNKPSTNVVCEGYSKAFQYLCDLSTFNNANIDCYTVSGILQGGTGAGNHMWNIVTMDDEVNYIVDVTNSDTGSVGASGGLFLSGYTSGSLNTGYTFNLENVVKYTYDSDTIAFWGNESSSILSISNSDYQPNHPVIKIELESITYDSEFVTAGDAESDADIKYSFSEDTWSELDYNWQVEWFNDNNGSKGSALSQAPIHSGNYWIKITASQKLGELVVIHSQKFTISKACLTISSVTADSKNYDGTNTITMTNIELQGVMNGDNVEVNKNLIVALVGSSNAGEYNTVSVSGVTLNGEDSTNYSINDIWSDLTSNKITIYSINPTVTPNYNLIHSQNKTLEDTLLTATAIGIGNKIVDGSINWMNESDEVLDNSTIVEFGKSYKWRFTPSSLNYNTITGNVVLWATNSVQSHQIIVNINNDTYGTVLGGGDYQSNQNVKITATPKDGYKFICWQEDGNTISTLSEYTFTATKNRIIVAVFEKIELNNDQDLNFTNVNMNKIVDVMWYIFYTLAGIALIASLYVIFTRKNKK